MEKKVGIIKRIFALLFIFLLNLNTLSAVVSDNDGSAFITKAEFDSLKNNFQSQIDQYNQSIDSKIDGAIAAYLAGISISNLPRNVNTTAKYFKEGINQLLFINNDEHSSTATFDGGGQLNLVFSGFFGGSAGSNNTPYSGGQDSVDYRSIENVKVRISKSNFNGAVGAMRMWWIDSDTHVVDRAYYSVSNNIVGNVNNRATIGTQNRAVWFKNIELACHWANFSASTTGASSTGISATSGSGQPRYINYCLSEKYTINANTLPEEEWIGRVIGRGGTTQGVVDNIWNIQKVPLASEDDKSVAATNGFLTHSDWYTTGSRNPSGVVFVWPGGGDAVNIFCNKGTWPCTDCLRINVASPSMIISNNPDDNPDFAWDNLYHENFNSMTITRPSAPNVKLTLPRYEWNADMYKPSEVYNNPAYTAYGILDNCAYGYCLYKNVDKAGTFSFSLCPYLFQGSVVSDAIVQFYDEKITSGIPSTTDPHLLKYQYRLQGTQAWSDEVTSAVLSSQNGRWYEFKMHLNKDQIVYVNASIDKGTGFYTGEGMLGVYIGDEATFQEDKD